MSTIITSKDEKLSNLLMLFNSHIFFNLTGFETVTYMLQVLFYKSLLLIKKLNADIIMVFPFVVIFIHCLCGLSNTKLMNYCIDKYISPLVVEQM